MTIYYLDPANGNDANDGLSWGTAWKTLLNGATSARLGLTDSDEIRIAKSPDPINIGNITWTTNSATVSMPTLSTTVVDQCESGWTAGLVTPTYTTSFVKQGTNSLQAVLSSTNGRVCYKAITADYSGFTRITFWVNFATAVNYSAGCPIQIRLCSDNAGNTAVNTFTLPSYYYPANYWVPITIDNVSALSSTIGSIAIYTTSAVSNTIRFDNICVAKAASDNTSLVLTDLIAKNDGNGEYRPINYFDGTNIGIDTAAATRSATFVHISTRFQCYPTGTETVPSLKRICFDTASQVITTAISTVVGQIWYTENQYDGMKKTYIGGYNTATNEVDGETWFDGVTTYGIGLNNDANGATRVLVQNISVVRYYTGYNFRIGTDSSITNISLVNNQINYQFKEASKLALFDLTKMVSNVFDINWMYAGAGSNSVNGSAESLSTTYQNAFNLRQKGQQVIYKIKNASIHNTGLIFNSVGYTDFESTGTLYIAQTDTNQRPFELPMTGVVKVNHVIFFGMTNQFRSPFCFWNSNNALTSRSGRIPQVKIQVSGTIIRIPGVWETSTGLTLLNQTRDSTVMVEGISPSHSLSNLTLIAGFTNAFYGGYTIFKNINTTLNFRDILPIDASFNSLNGLMVIDGVNGDSNAQYVYLPQGHRSSGSFERTGYWKKDTTQVYNGTYSWARLWNIPNANVLNNLPVAERFDLGEIACKANKQVTVSTYVKRVTGTPIPVWLEIFDYNSNDMFVTTKMEDGVYDTWTKVTVTYTPTVDTLIQVAYRIGPCASGITFNSAIYFDALSITQAD